MRKPKKTIFTELIKHKIPFAVVSSVITLKNLQITDSAFDYWLVAHKSDVEGLGLGFSQQEDIKYTDFPRVLERDLSQEEIYEFKEKINLFEITQRDIHGKIFELIENSFKAHYKFIHPKKEIRICDIKIPKVEEPTNIPVAESIAELELVNSETEQDD